ncbi:hypothetical protein PanWU01x14_126020 [Parasponia andersonii]|uniref:Uncharacterized protein n=1 Tax=Parasponia andersonii TaxID=3476 RepID=A0A2P5CTB1_PARAD|nr:hypothetical protein PanWU01x14_126020 [Parasponia andersonii]
MRRTGGLASGGGAGVRTVLLGFVSNDVVGLGGAGAAAPPNLAAVVVPWELLALELDDHDLGRRGVVRQELDHVVGALFSEAATTRDASAGDVGDPDPPRAAALI